MCRRAELVTRPGAGLVQVPPDPQRGAAGRGSGAEAPRDGGADGGRDGDLLRDHLLPRIYRYTGLGTIITVILFIISCF